VSYFGLAILNNGVYEPEMVRVLQQHLQAGDCFVDIGANEAYFSVISAAIVGNEGRVLALEPQSRLQPVIEKNLQLNRYQDRVKLIMGAAGAESGNMDLYLTPDVNSGASGLLNITRYRLKTESVKVFNLAELMTQNGIDQIDLLKMDIEGGEYQAIFGSRELFIEKKVKTFALELHPAHLSLQNKDAQDIVDFLEQCGYRQLDAYENTVFTVD